MLMTDQINLPGMVGFSPLRGANDDALGPRFPDMTVAFDLELRTLTERIAAEKGVELRKGVYVGLAGPAFETPAEVRMLRALGGDAVGMSTVNEVTVGRHAGMRVLGFSGITNVAIAEGSADQTVNHEEVLDVGSRIVPRLITLLRGVIAQIE
jgi:purine-nucleoside phosphorylase